MENKKRDPEKLRKDLSEIARKGVSRGGEKQDWLLKETDELLKSLIDKEKEIIRTEDALVEAMRRFRDLFEQSPIGVGIYDLEGELLIVNNSFLQIFGLDSFGKITFQNLFLDMDITEESIKDIRAGKVVQYEAQYDFDKTDFESDRDGVGHMLFSVSPLVREGATIGYMAQVQDMTERKKAEEAQRLAQLGRLLSDMAHEVNNPLMIISGRAELSLLEGIEDEKVRDTLNIIMDQCFLAKDIIQRLLRYSRIGKVDKKPLDIYSILDLITRILDHHFKLSNISVEKEIQAGLPPVMGNDKQLQQVFMNVMRNSADAMPDGGVIRVKVSENQDMMRIDISDSGEGMSQKVLDRIFEPFFTTKQKGTGLGLAVCHTIMEEHNGNISYKSNIGKGTTATLLLPFEHSPGSGGSGVTVS